MHVALVEDAQHDVDRHQCERDQERLARQRLLECLRRSLERSTCACRKADVPGGSIDGGHRLPQRGVWSEVERDRHGGKLSLVVDAERRRRLGDLGEGAERHLRARRRAHVQHLHLRRIHLELRFHLQHDAVLVQLRVHGGDLALAEGVVEGVVDRLRRDAEPRRGVPIHRDVQAEPVRLLIGIHVAQLREGAQFLQDPRRPLRQLVEIRVHDRVLVLRAGEPAAQAHVLDVLQEEADALHARELGPQLAEHLVGGELAHAPWLQLDEEEAGVSLSDEGNEVLDVRILGDHLVERLGPRFHRREGDVLRRLRAPRQRACVLLRKEALGNHDVEIDGEGDGSARGGEHQPLVLEHPTQRAAVRVAHPVEGAFRGPVEPAVLQLAVVLQHARGHHRGDRQGHDCRDGNGERQGHRELPEEAAHQSAHQ